MMLVGIDVVDISRFDKLVGDKHFLDKYFTKYESEYIFTRPKPIETMAGLYASKEAFLKALGIGIGRGIELKEISVRHDELGKPYYDIDNEILREKLSKYSVGSVDLSISHSGSVSTAICVFC